ncbi:hypothetical protein Pan44_01930 [Caulifigura coniformis]|uniref:Uncharacterized protein n=1 Tax=Caulifigura coniformis TaxID=2527983 RepID=A0A517S7U6_9PLAN|nr:biotin/lipoyl-binding protein [Caulifigura coniformis]QDT52184.1 hypothetical protein Pan44_01930 [Caulifigura coniformis]
MQPSRPTPTSTAAEQVAYDALLVAVDSLGRQATDEQTYYGEVLRLLLREAPFDAVAVWSINDAEAVLKACAPAEAPFPTIPSDELQRAISSRALERLQHDPSANGNSHSRPTRLLAAAAIHGPEAIAVEASLKPGVPTDRPMRLLEAIAELVGHVETRFRYLVARSRVADSSAVEQIACSFHEGQSVQETALLIAAGLQQALGSDRCWVCRTFDGQARIIASNTPGDVARRQLLARKVEEVARTAATTGGERSWSTGESATAELLSLAEEGLARRITVLPLVPPASDSAVGAVVLEQFSAAADPNEVARRRSLVPHASLALQHALAMDRGNWWRRLTGDGPRRGWKLATAVALMMAAALFLALPVPFEVEADGRLLPATVRSIFAPADGVVMTLHVRHGQRVTPDAPLLELRSPDLDLEGERVAGQISEVTAQLASIQVLRAQGRRPAGESSGDLSAQEEQLRAALAGANEQQALIEEQKRRLSIRSPMAGVVDRWDLDEALASRPVVRGQHLCDVLDVAGPWKLDLRIPDKSAGFVFAARESTPELPVRYVLRTDPRAEFTTQLSAVGDRTEVDDAGSLVVRGTAVLPEESGPAKRAGASVIARIDCGRRSRVFVWFHELWDFVSLTLL